MSRIGDFPGSPASVFEDAGSTNTGIFLSTKLNGYQADDLQDETLWLIFRDDFRDWNTDSFNNCPRNTVYKFRDILRQRGVWVEKLDTTPAAQSLNNTLHEPVQTKWTEQEIRNYLKKGGRFISDSIDHYMLENNIPFPRNLLSREQSPTRLSQPQTPLYLVLRMPQGGTPNPTPPAPTEPTRHPLNHPQPTTIQGPSNDARNPNPPNQPAQPIRQPNNFAEAGNRPGRGLGDAQSRSEPLNPNGLRNGQESGNRGIPTVGYELGDTGNTGNGFRDRPHNGTGHGFGNCIATLEKIYKD